MKWSAASNFSTLVKFGVIMGWIARAMLPPKWSRIAYVYSVSYDFRSENGVENRDGGEEEEGRRRGGAKRNPGQNSTMSCTKEGRTEEGSKSEEEGRRANPLIRRRRFKGEAMLI